MGWMRGAGGWSYGDGPGPCGAYGC